MRHFKNVRLISNIIYFTRNKSTFYPIKLHSEQKERKEKKNKVRRA